MVHFEKGNILADFALWKSNIFFQKTVILEQGLNLYLLRSKNSYDFYLQNLLVRWAWQVLLECGVCAKPKNGPGKEERGLIKHKCYLIR